MPDQLDADIVTAVRALARWKLGEQGHHAAARRLGQPFSVRLLGTLYVIRSDVDGEPIAGFEADDVAFAVGVLRAARDAREAGRN